MYQAGPTHQPFPVQAVKIAHNLLFIKSVTPEDRSRFTMSIHRLKMTKKSLQAYIFCQDMGHSFSGESKATLTKPEWPHTARPTLPESERWEDELKKMRSQVVSPQTWKTIWWFYGLRAVVSWCLCSLYGWSIGCGGSVSNRAHLKEVPGWAHNANAGQLLWLGLCFSRSTSTNGYF